MSDPRKDAVRQGYDAIGERYHTWSQGSAVRLRWLRKLLERLPENGDVLELGCGAGVPATRAIAERAKVLGVDISPAQITRAKANVPAAAFRCADVTALDFPPASFDAVAAFCVLTQIPREEHAALLARIARWLKPGGIFLATLGASDLADTLETDWLGAPNFFSHFDAGTNLALVKAAGFEVLEHAVELQDLPGEEHVRFLWVLATR